jgi:hypothetical protein
MSQAWGAATSVVMGVVVGFLTNLITSKFTVPLSRWARHDSDRVGSADVRPSVELDS